METMTLKDIQNVSLEILKEIDSFCCEHNINYSLGYGALIGAVRHKGCIPWDDDIDVVMPRPDYDKFIHTYRSGTGTYELYAPELGNCYYTVTRLCEMNKTHVRKCYQWTDKQTGVWVDIFPIDAIPKRDNNIYKLSARCYVACRNKKIISFKQSFLYNLKSAALLFKYGFLDRKKCIDDYLSTISKCSYLESDKVANYASPYRLKDIHSKNLFESYIRVPFENIEVNIIKAYSEYLSALYGNYMQLPPETQRVRGHDDNDFYWI